MSDTASPALPPTASRAAFWITAVVAFVVVLSVLVLWPRGAATGEEIAGDEVVVDLREGVTAGVIPAIRDLGWRAQYATRPYEIGLRMTIDNTSDELFPRWYRVTVFEAENLVDGEDLPRRMTDSLQTSHVDPGGQAATDFTFEYHDACGEFIARITSVPSLEEEDDRSSVDVPFTVGDDQCLAAR